MLTLYQCESEYLCNGSFTMQTSAPLPARRFLRQSARLSQGIRERPVAPSGGLSCDCWRAIGTRAQKRPHSESACERRAGVAIVEYACRPAAASVLSLSFKVVNSLYSLKTSYKLYTNTYAHLHTHTHHTVRLLIDWTIFLEQVI